MHRRPHLTCHPDSDAHCHPGTLGEGEAEEAFDVAGGKCGMTGRIHIVRSASQRYRLMFVPGGPDRHLIEGEGALRDFLLTELDIPPGVAETALHEIHKSGRFTIENIAVTDKIKDFWRLDTAPKPTSPEPQPTSSEPPKPAKRTPRRVVARRTRAKPKPTKKAKQRGRSGR